MPVDQLRHLDSEDVLKWRKVGDTTVVTESEWEEGRDDTITLHELNEDGEELERCTATLNAKAMLLPHFGLCSWLVKNISSRMRFAGKVHPLPLAASQTCGQVCHTRADFKLQGCGPMTEMNCCRDMGRSIEEAVMKHLHDNLPMDGQQRVVEGMNLHIRRCQSLQCTPAACAHCSLPIVDKHRNATGSHSFMPPPDLESGL